MIVAEVGAADIIDHQTDHRVAEITVVAGVQLLPLAQGGEDTLENTVALCPTHHRYLHIGKGRDKLTQELQARRRAEAFRVLGEAQGNVEIIG